MFTVVSPLSFLIIIIIIIIIIISYWSKKKSNAGLWFVFFGGRGVGIFQPLVTNRGLYPAVHINTRLAWNERVAGESPYMPKFMKSVSPLLDLGLTA